MLADKISAAERLIEDCLRTYQRPVVMSSFGKDSMVLLEIIKQMGKKFPILFHRESFFPKKYEFANQVISDNDYSVYDYAPLMMAVTKNGTTMEIVNHFQVGKSYCYLPIGIVEPEAGKEHLCGLTDLYQKPTGTFNFPWDGVFIGHKSSDICPILGPAPLRVDIRLNANAADYIYPLRHFTDADIWDYHARFVVPVNDKRYDAANDFKEFPDLTFNNDYFPTCTRCIDRNQPNEVFCPKANAMIPNISATVRYVEPALPDYVGDEVAVASRRIVGEL